MIFRRGALREFANVAGAVFVALFAILLTTALIRLLGQAAGGKLASEAVLALLGFGALNYLPIILSLTLFISILLTLSRTYRDYEMIIWFTSGQPLTAWVRPVMLFAAPLVAAIAVLSLYLSPWASSKSAAYRQVMSERDDVSQIKAGAFREASDGERVFFVEGVAKNTSSVKNIFVSSAQHGRLGVMVSKEGYQETMPNGDRFAVLLKGRRYDGTPGTAEYRLMEFERYAIRIETKEAQAVENSPKSAPLTELLDKPTNANKGELLWRLAIPLQAINLALLAVPLSFVNPQAGRANNLLLAIFTFLIYGNLINVSQAWVTQGRLSFGIGLWAVHVLMFVALIVLFYRRISVYSWFRSRL
jgi:lipopolysaccharide export system permease protein